MDSTIKNNIIKMKEDMALKIFNSENGNFNDLKKLNILFDLILKFIDFLETRSQNFKYNVLSFKGASTV